MLYGLHNFGATEELISSNCGAGEDLRIPWTAGRSNQSILKEINPVYSLEGDAEAEAPILWPPDVKRQLWKRPWCWEKLKAGAEGVAEGEMVKEHPWLDGHEFDQTLGANGEQKSLAGCSRWDLRVRQDLASEQQYTPKASETNDPWRNRIPSSELKSHLDWLIPGPRIRTSSLSLKIMLWRWVRSRGQLRYDDQTGKIFTPPHPNHFLGGAAEMEWTSHTHIWQRYWAARPGYHFGFPTSTVRALGKKKQL